MRAFLILVLCGLELVAQERPVRKAGSLPDVYLVTIDTLRADHVHCYGYEQIQTPALDGLAREGVRFANAFTPSPITNTSHTSILTGLLPSAHGVTDFARPLSSDHSTLAELLKGKGYQTAAFIGAVILDSHAMAPGLDRGFDFYDNFPEHPQSASRWGRLERRGAEVVRRAEAWREAHPSGPHFMWVHLYDPHDPYEPPEPYASQYKSRLYDGEIAYADSALGNFVSHLKERGWYDNAIIVVVGDHGEGLGEHREETHGVFLYDTTLHVPLIIKLPGKNSVRTVQSQVRTTDIFPTILELVNVAVPEKLDGASLNSAMTGEEGERPVIAETDYPLHFGWAPLRALRADGLKFIEAPRPELYDLAKDPNEVSNGYEPWSEAVKKLRKVLADRWAQMPRPGPTSATVPVGTLDELKALGYLGPADAGSATNVPEPSMLPDAKDKIEEQNLLHAAMMATEAGRPADARTDLEKLLELNPKSEAALVQLGNVLLRQGDFGKAAEYLNRARAIRPEDATAALYYGEALEKSGDLAGAKTALEECVKLNPKQSAEARVVLGRVYLGLGDASAAEDQFEAVLLMQPLSLDGQSGIAEVQISRRQFAEALKTILPLSKLPTANSETFELLGQAYAGLGRTTEAAQAQARAKELAKAKMPAGNPARN